MPIHHNALLCSTSEDFTLSITSNGNAFCTTDWQAIEASPPYTRLYYIVDGAGEIETAKERLTLKKNHLYLLPIGHFFSHWCEDHMQQLYFHVNLTNRYGADILRGINRVLSKEVDPGYIQKLLSLFETDDFVARGSLKTLLQTDVFSLLLENGIQIQNRQLSPSVQKALTYIESNLSAALSVQAVTEYVAIPSITLCNKFKAEMGISIGKKHGKSVQRNRIKRLIREAFRLNQDKMKGTYSFIIIPKVREEYSFSTFERDLRWMIKKEEL